MRISDWSSDVCSSDLAAMPLPSEDTTPPVTKMSGVTGLAGVMAAAARWKAPFYRLAARRARRGGIGSRPAARLVLLVGLLFRLHFVAGARLVGVRLDGGVRRGVGLGIGVRRHCGIRGGL